MDFQHIWTDGSYRPSHGTMGAGIVISVKDKPLCPIQHSIRLATSRNDNGSDISELWAIAHGMKFVKSGHFHSDCQNVVEWVKNGKIDNTKKARDREVMAAFDLVLSRKAELSAFFISYASADSSRNMGLAHTLSRQASTPQKDRTFRNVRHFRR